MGFLTVNAEDVRNGDTLPDFGHGYVFIDPEQASDEIAWSGRYTSAFDDDFVLITFHDEDGEENYLILHSSFPVKVQR